LQKRVYQHPHVLLSVCLQRFLGSQWSFNTVMFR
jgi:hypothetical protein